MNTSTFMDKQIMDLTAAAGASPNDFIDLNSHQHTPPLPIQRGVDDDDEGEESLPKDDIQPSYEFHPIRPLQSTNHDSGSAASLGASRARNSTDSKPFNTSSPRNKVTIESANRILANDGNARDEAILLEIDRTMNKYSEDLLHALEGVSARLTQLETRTRNLENSVDDIKVSVGNNHGSTDGKMRQLENILREVQTGVQVLRDKHEIIEAHLQLSKLQVSLTKQHSEIPSTAGLSSMPQTISAPLQDPASQQPASFTPHHDYQQLPTPAPAPSFPTPQNVAPLALHPQTFVPQPQPTNQIPQNQVPPSAQYPPPTQAQEDPNQHYHHTPTQQSQPPPSSMQYPPPTQTQDDPNQHYHHPSAQQPQPPSSAPHQQHPGSYPSYPQAPHQHSSMPPLSLSQTQPPVNIRQEEAPYMLSQNYAPPLPQPFSHQPSAGAPSQQYYGPPSQVYDQPPPRSNLGYSSGYGAPTGPSEPSYPYNGSGQYSGSAKLQQPPSGNGYPQLSAARMLPQAIPTASAVGGGSGSSGTGNNRVPVEDVVDKVTSMGFSREQVRATVRRLTENGQSVDLNIVLDKLMNDSDVQPPKGWYGR